MPNWLLYLIAAGIVFGLAFSAMNMALNAKYQAGVNSCVAAQKTAVVEKTKSNGKNTREILHLDDAALIRRYCRWVYGGSYDECVRTVKPLD